MPHKPLLNTAPTSVLLVEDDAADARLIQQALVAAEGCPFQVESVTRLDQALERLGRAAVEVILLDLTLPDCQGIAVFDQVSQAAPNALIMVLTTAGDEAGANQAVQHGAHDYLVKSHLDAHWLPRALRYLIERKDVQEELRTSEARFRAISDASPLGIFVSNAEGSCVYTNTAYQMISGLNQAQTLGTNWSMAIHPEDRERVLAEWRISARSQEPFQTEYRFQQADASVVWTRVNSAAMLDGRRALGLVQTVEDITERKVTEEALFEEKERAQVTLNSIGDAVLTTDLPGNVTYLNLVAEKMTGWSREEAIGQPLTKVFQIVDGASRQTATNPALHAIRKNQTVEMAQDSVLIRRDGTESAIEDSAAPIHNREGQVIGAVMVFHDVSLSRAMTLKMAHLAQHDFLTGLPNRLLLTERLSQAIRLANRHKKQIALLFIDLDYFKHINDSLGHAIGDLLLKSVAERLTSSVRDTDTVCRQGGDEFVILLAEIEDPQAATRIAEKLLAAFELLHLIDGHELHVGMSIGISIFPDDGSNVDDVLQNADTAMFHAKAAGRSQYQFFRADMNTNAIHRQAVETSLRRALKQGEFLLHYQPQIDLASGAITGTEALLRWQEPELGLVLPGQFVAIAEQCGLIVPIGRWVMREACRQVQSWLDAGLPAVPVAVNISALEFRQPNFLDGIALILRETGLAPRFLELELTERILMHDAESSAAVLHALKAMGVRLAIDDFGTGYSSLSNLKSFPIDTLKIDQSLVRDIITDSNDAIIVSTVIGIGRNLNQRVIAEGVETPEQLTFLQTRQCEVGQGYQFSHPLSGEGFGRLLANGETQLAQKEAEATPL